MSGVPRAWSGLDDMGHDCFRKRLAFFDQSGGLETVDLWEQGIAQVRRVV